MSIFSPATLGRIIDHGQGLELSPSELWVEIMKRRDVYYSLGMRKGDKAIINHGNSYQYFADLFALWEIGVCCVPIDSQTSLSEMANLISHCNAKLIVYRDHFDLGELKKLLEYDVVAVDSHDVNEGTGGANGHGFQDQCVGWDDQSLILYTSGSTGRPKGVVHTFRSLWARLYLLRADVPLESLHTTLNLLPTHFGHGLICNSMYPLLNGHTLVILPAFNVGLLSELGSIIDRYQVNFMSSVPTVWRIAMRFSDSPVAGTLARVHCGSAPLSAKLFAGIREWCGTSNVRNAYGITEVGSWLGGTESDVSELVDGYVGKGWGTDIMVLDPGTDPGSANAQKYELSSKVEGDVWIRTPSLMQGYYERPDLTEEAVKNTWFRTGDVGYKNQCGGLVLVGRRHHEINKAGMKVYPEDIDLVLEQSPTVAEACSFGIDDPIAGQVVGVALVLMDPEDGLEATKKWLGDRISPHKFPTKWFPVRSITRDSRGKVNREQVAAICLQAGRA